MENIKENKETKIMKKNKREVRSIAEATLDAKERGLKEFKIGNEIYDVKKTWKLLSEEEMENCEQCGQTEEGSCNECGGMLNEYGECDECGDTSEENVVMESKKTKLRLNEDQLVNLINKIVKKTMVNESVPGIEVTKRAQKTSGSDSKSHMSDVAKKMKKTLSFDGNDNPEFPKQIGKGEKVAHRNTKEEEETIEDYRGGGLEDLDYGYEPSDKFKDRLKKSLKGHSTMGNSHDSPNVMKSDLGEKILKKIDRKAKKVGKETVASWGTAIKEPIVVKENKNSVVLNKEMNRMKQMFKYNKKTQ